MDPQVTWDQLAKAIDEQQWEEATELASTLLEWLNKGGFPPRTHPELRVSKRGNRLYATEICKCLLCHRGRQP